MFQSHSAKVLCAAFVAVVFSACSDTAELNAQVKLVVSATRSAQETAADIRTTLESKETLEKVLLAADAPASPLRAWQSYSFTPSALEVRIDNVIVFTEWTQNPDGETIGGGQEISLSVGRTIDLMSAQALGELYAQEFSLSEDKFGSYIGTKVLMSDTILVSGTATVNGVDFAVDRVPVRIGFSGSHLAFTRPLDIADTAQSPTLRLVIETENVAILSNPEAGSGADSDTPTLEDGTHVGLANMVVLAYVGSAAPRIEKYGLTVDGDTTYALKVLLVEDEYGKIVTAAIQPVYFDGFAPSGYPQGTISPAHWTQPVIQGDAIVGISMNTLYYDEGASDRFVSFAAFQRQDHAGVLQVGAPTGTERSYSAKRYQTLQMQ